MTRGGAGWTHGGMHLCIAAIYDAELWRFSPRTVAVRYVRYVRTYVYDRISTGETNSISGTVRVRSSVRPSLRPSVRSYVCERARSQTAPRDKLIVRGACAKVRARAHAYTHARSCAEKNATLRRKRRSCLLDTLDELARRRFSASNDLLSTETRFLYLSRLFSPRRGAATFSWKMARRQMRCSILVNVSSARILLYTILLKYLQM